MSDDAVWQGSPGGTIHNTDGDRVNAAAGVLIVRQECTAAMQPSPAAAPFSHRSHLLQQATAHWESAAAAESAPLAVDRYLNLLNESEANWSDRYWQRCQEDLSTRQQAVARYWVPQPHSPAPIGGV